MKRRHELVEKVRRLYDAMPWPVRSHVRARLRLCPYDEIAAMFAAQGPLLDVGCGYGHFCWYLTFAYPGAAVLGCDVDARKVTVARAIPCPGGVRAPKFLLGAVQEVPAGEGPFAGIAVLDVLYLLPEEDQRRLVEWAAQRLAPAGCLVIKALDTEARWRARRALLQEWLMVRVLRRTSASGAKFHPRPPEEYRGWLETLGLATGIRRLCTVNPSALIWGARA
jgi:2-polyprenyl-3-methyl-5-hydroxy-6-metoxy-1,4-benzoquinol methylase